MVSIESISRVSWSNVRAVLGWTDSSQTEEIAQTPHGLRGPSATGQGAEVVLGIVVGHT
jgi:hypothetical protein